MMGGVCNAEAPDAGHMRRIIGCKGSSFRCRHHSPLRSIVAGNDGSDALAICVPVLRALAALNLAVTALSHFGKRDFQP